MEKVESSSSEDAKETNVLLSFVDKLDFNILSKTPSLMQ